MFTMASEMMHKNVVKQLFGHHQYQKLKQRLPLLNVQRFVRLHLKEL
jgi:hypothetical protein